MQKLESWDITAHQLAKFKIETTDGHCFPQERKNAAWVPLPQQIATIFSPNRNIRPPSPASLGPAALQT